MSFNTILLSLIAAGFTFTAIARSTLAHVVFTKIITHEMILRITGFCQFVRNNHLGLVTYAAWACLVSVFMAWPAAEPWKSLVAPDSNSDNPVSLLFQWEPALLLMLTFSATFLSFLSSRDTPMHEHLGVPLDTYIETTSSSIRALGTLMFRSSLVIIFTGPLWLAQVPSELYGLPVGIFCRATWLACLALVATCLFFVALTSIRTSLIKLSNPGLIANKVEQDLDRRTRIDIVEIYTHARRFHGSGETDFLPKTETMTHAWCQLQLEAAQMVPPSELSHYLDKTVSHRAWTRRSLHHLRISERNINLQTKILRTEKSPERRAKYLDRSVFEVKCIEVARISVLIEHAQLSHISSEFRWECASHAMRIAEGTELNHRCKSNSEENSLAHEVLTQKILPCANNRVTYIHETDPFKDLSIGEATAKALTDVFLPTNSHTRLKDIELEKLMKFTANLGPSKTTDQHLIEYLFMRVIEATIINPTEDEELPPETVVKLGAAIPRPCLTPDSTELTEKLRKTAVSAFIGSTCTLPLREAQSLLKVIPVDYHPALLLHRLASLSFERSTISGDHVTPFRRELSNYLVIPDVPDLDRSMNILSQSARRKLFQPEWIEWVFDRFSDPGGWLLVRKYNEYGNPVLRRCLPLSSFLVLHYTMARNFKLGDTSMERERPPMSEQETAIRQSIRVAASIIREVNENDYQALRSDFYR